MVEREVSKRGQCARCHRRLTDPVSIYRGTGPVCWAASGGDAFEADLEASDEEWTRREQLLRAGGEIDLGCNWEYDEGEDYLPCTVRVSVRFVGPHPGRPEGVFEAYGRLINSSWLVDGAEVVFSSGTDLRAVYAAAVMAGPRCAAQAAWRRKQLARRFRARAA